MNLLHSVLSWKMIISTQSLCEKTADIAQYREMNMGLGQVQNPFPSFISCEALDDSFTFYVPVSQL